MAEKRVLIRHKDGREYSIRREDFDKKDVIRIEGDQFGSFEEAGFEVVGEDTPRARRAATKDKE